MNYDDEESFRNQRNSNKKITINNPQCDDNQMFSFTNEINGFKNDFNNTNISHDSNRNSYLNNKSKTNQSNFTNMNNMSKVTTLQQEIFKDM